MKSLYLTAAAAALLVTPAAAEMTDGKIKIGVLNDQSGVYSALGGTGSLEAVKMAAEEFGGKIGDARPFLRITKQGFRVLVMCHHVLQLGRVLQH